MKHTPFLKGLIITSIIAFIISYALSLLPQEAPFQRIIFDSLIFFSSFTIVHYLIGLSVVDHPNKGLYIGMVQLFSGIKVALTVAFIVVFMEVEKPETTWFVLPFLLNYAIFTVYETTALMRVGNKKPKQKDHSSK